MPIYNNKLGNLMATYANSIKVHRSSLTHKYPTRPTFNFIALICNLKNFRLTFPAYQFFEGEPLCITHLHFGQKKKHTERNKCASGDIRCCVYANSNRIFVAAGSIALTRACIVFMIKFKSNERVLSLTLSNFFNHEPMYKILIFIFHVFANFGLIEF